MKDFSEKACLNNLLVTQPYEKLRYISKDVGLVYCGWTVGSETLFFERRPFFPAAFQVLCFSIKNT